MLLLAVFGLNSFTTRVVRRVEPSLRLKAVYDLLSGKGGPTKTLVLFANNYELRAGGGFVGTVGLLEGDNGRVRLDQVRSVYYYDHRIEDKKTFATVPEYLGNLTSVLAVRDSLNSASEQQSAVLARDLFARETGIHADQILILTPSVLESLLGITGPIELSDYHLTVQSDNLLESLQKEVEAGKDKQSGKDPKTILSVLFNKIMDRLPETSVSHMAEMVSLIESSSAQRQLALMSGEQLNVNQLGFYRSRISDNALRFGLLTSNHGANKSSRAVARKVTVDLNLDEQGIMTGSIMLNLQHTSDYFAPYVDPRSGQSTWLIGENLSWYGLQLPIGTRVLDPSGWSLTQDDTQVVLGRSISLRPLEKAQVATQVQLPTRYVMGQRLIIDIGFIKQFGATGQPLALSVKVPDGYHQVEAKDRSNAMSSTVSTIVTQDTDISMTYIFER